jgi:hypothetical protein
MKRGKKVESCGRREGEKFEIGEKMEENERGKNFNRNERRERREDISEEYKEEI